MLNTMTGIKMVHVPYRAGNLALNDLLGGHISVTFSTTITSTQFIKTGKVRALAATSSQRVPAFPDLPTVAESGVPGYDVRFWVGLTAPRGTPIDVIKKIEGANNKALAMPEVQKVLAAQGFSPWIGTSEEFDAFYRSERDKWAKVIKSTGMDKE
jgi:tripartite-type tricarboxylate transporter receptor subunit TctC